MRLKAHGRQHAEKSHKLGNIQISELVNTGLLGGGKDGNVTLKWTVDKVQMGGSFQFYMDFSREDVALVFIESMSSLSLDQVVKLLADSQKLIE